MKRNKILVTMLIAGGLVSPFAHATNGYFPIGYGAKTEGMGGAGIALPQDSIAAANNPAGMVMMGDRIDFGLIWFKPSRSTTITGNDCSGFAGPGCTLNGTYDGNGESNFFIPSFGYNKMINADTSLGVSIFGNGGMNTQYNTSPLTRLGGTSPLGINLEQLFIAPTWSKKLNPTNAVGVSLNLAYQIFSANGLEPFANASGAKNDLTGNGSDTSTGYGLRVGWTGEVTPTVTLGATYQTKTKMSKFSNYSGLFAEQGGFDIPSNFGVGIAVKATPATTVAFDVERTNYADVPSVGNPLVLPAGPGGPFLGANNGAGFGWQNINAFKLGVSYAYDSKLTLRAGLNHCDQPITSSQTFFNVVAPGIVQDHLSLGATWTLANKSELTVAYIHAFSQTVNGSSSGYGPGSIPGVPGAAQPLGGFGGGNANISMHQDSISVSYGW